MTPSIDHLVGAGEQRWRRLPTREVKLGQSQVLRGPLFFQIGAARLVLLGFGVALMPSSNG
jgi:hypothetical protein